MKHIIAVRLGLRMPEEPTIAALILAAGASTRLGQPKQLIEHDGRTLLRNAAEAALGGHCRPVVVVLGARSALMRGELEGLEVRVVEHRGWREGLGSSIGNGVTQVLESGEAPEAMMLLLCDQPGLSAEVVRRLAAAWRRAYRKRGATLAACEYAGTLGPPAIFARAELSRLVALAGDRGAKAILLEAGDRVVRMRWEPGAIDVDLPGDCTSGGREL
jgi:molybdenum cofactor cytidylyltransferase